jgi:hypothetical protein
MCKNEVILQQVFDTIKIGDLVSRMVIERDLQTAKHAFHICKQFAKFSKMYPTVMLKKSEIVTFIMICLKDQSL